VYRKGELSAAGTYRGWPYQLVLPANTSLGGSYKVVQDFCSDLSQCRRGHAVFHDDKWFNVYCFADRQHAEKF